MTPPFVAGLFGWRGPRRLPNCADSDNSASIRIAIELMRLLDVPEDAVGPTDAGTALEEGVKGWLAEQLAARTTGRTWTVARHRLVTDFVQYEHLARLQSIIDHDETRTLRVEIGGDYLIKPDVTVGLVLPIGEMLHASVSCKWTIRSDRVQNIRVEAIVLTRHRRGRQPHIVSLTAEPLPSRLASIARGTGEVDAVYHVALPQLVAATNRYGTGSQRDILDELVSQRRLFDLEDLAQVLID